MAGELSVPWTSGSTVYAFIYSPWGGNGGNVFNNSTGLWEAYNASNLSAYAITMTEQGSTGLFVGDVPGGCVGNDALMIHYRQRQGGSVAAADKKIKEAQYLAQGNNSWLKTLEMSL